MKLIGRNMKLIGVSMKLSDHPSLPLASFFGCGFFPIAPATFASGIFTIIAILLLQIMPQEWLLPFWLASTLIWFVVGIRVTQRLLQSPLCKNKTNDPSFVVIDELAGQSLAFALAPHNEAGYVAAFFLFRFFDIIKPFPVHLFERLKAAWGVMSDDIAAGIYVMLCFALWAHYG